MGCSGSKAAAAVWEAGLEPTQAHKRPKAAGGKAHGVDIESAEQAVSTWKNIETAAVPALTSSREGGAWEEEAADLEDIGQQVLGHCASIADGESMAAEGMGDLTPPSILIGSS